MVESLTTIARNLRSAVQALSQELTAAREAGLEVNIQVRDDAGDHDSYLYSGYTLEVKRIRKTTTQEL